MSETLEKPAASFVTGIVDAYIEELDIANKKLDAAIQFIELLEGLTTDKDTANRIRKYLQQEGIWPLPQKN